MEEIIPAGYSKLSESFDLLGRTYYGQEWNQEEVLCEGMLSYSKKARIATVVPQVSRNLVRQDTCIKTCLKRGFNDAQALGLVTAFRYESIRKEILSLMGGKILNPVLFDRTTYKQFLLPFERWAPEAHLFSYSFVTGEGKLVMISSGLLSFELNITVTYQGPILLKTVEIQNVLEQIKSETLPQLSHNKEARILVPKGNLGTWLNNFIEQVLCSEFNLKGSVSSEGVWVQMRELANTATEQKFSVNPSKCSKGRYITWELRKGGEKALFWKTFDNLVRNIKNVHGIVS